jgi:hypothetical protein
MARVLLITPYNESDLGTRQLIANLRAEGHEAYLLCSKLTRTKEIPDDREWDPLWQVSVLPGGGLRILSYPQPLSQREQDLLKSLVKKLSPDFIGISVYTAFVSQAREITALAREAAPTAVVAWGGPHVTLDPEGSAQHCDVAFVGECDLILGDFLRALERGEDWRKTPNIVWREQGRPTANQLVQWSKISTQSRTRIGDRMAFTISMKTSLSKDALTISVSFTRITRSLRVVGVPTCVLTACTH